MREQIPAIIPDSKAELHIKERLHALAKHRERSMNYLVIEALVQYLDREEAKEEANDRPD